MESEPEELPPDVAVLRTTLLEWYERDHRAFPWRETEDPYKILVCEVMSQQTQLDRIIGPWQGFLDRWPTVEDLAAAERADVLSFWTANDLGYNNRARYLHEAASQVIDKFDGEIPQDPEVLESLMGVGPYTANAVASFAFNTGNAVVDTNVKRVLYRAFDVPDDDTAFETVASSLMPEGQSRAWNNAIMELGGVACRKAPACDDAACPWRQWCAAYRTGDFEAPDVPEQTTFEGSRRQMRGRVIDALSSQGTLSLSELGPRVRVDYSQDETGPDDNVPENSARESGEPRDRSAPVEGADGGPSSRDNGPAWLLGLLRDLEADGLIEVTETGDGYEASLAR